MHKSKIIKADNKKKIVTPRRITDGVSAKPVNSMSMAEFKAWLEGFSECFKNGSPNKAQWKRVEERLCAVNTNQTIVYRDRPYWWNGWNGGLNLIANSGVTYRGVDSVSGDPVQLSQTSAAEANVSNTLLCATAIGKEEAKEFTM